METQIAAIEAATTDTTSTEDTSMETFPIHPFCQAVPEMSAEQYEYLKNDIAETGFIRESIVLLDDQVLDGRHRQQACIELGIAPDYVPWMGTEAEARKMVISANLARRHLTDGQKAMAAADIMSAPSHRPVKGEQVVTRKQAADAAGISERSVTHAKTVQDKGTPELEEAVRKGDVAVSDAAAVADAPAEVQKAAVEGVAKAKQEGRKSTLQREAAKPENGARIYVSPGAKKKAEKEKAEKNALKVAKAEAKAAEERAKVAEAKAAEADNARHSANAKVEDLEAEIKARKASAETTGSGYEDRIDALEEEIEARDKEIEQRDATIEELAQRLHGAGKMIEEAQAAPEAEADKATIFDTFTSIELEGALALAQTSDDGKDLEADSADPTERLAHHLFRGLTDSSIRFKVTLA